MQKHSQENTISKYPLLEAQNGIVFSWIQHPKLTQHNMGFAHQLSRDIDVMRLRDAMLHTAERHKTFKTRIEHTEESFCQYIDPTIVFDIKISSMSENEYASYKRHFVHPFDMLNDVLIRMEIVETESFIYALVDMAHVIADGYTLTQFWHEVDESYQNREPEVHDHLEQAVEREHASFDTTDYEEARQHCLSTFSGMEITHIPSSSPHAIGSLKEVATFVSQNQIDSFCQQQDITPSMLFMIANAIALSALCNEDKIVIDALYHGRSDKDTAHTLGMFVKNILVLFDFEKYASATVGELAAIIRQQFHVQHKGIYPFTHFARDLELSFSSNNTFTFQNWYKPVSINNVVAKSEYLKDGETDEDTMVLIYPMADQYRVTIYYNDARYQEWFMQNYTDIIVDIALNIINHPHATISQIGLLSPKKKEAVLQLSEGEHIVNNDGFLELFEKQVQVSPDSIAVVDTYGKLTYSQLDVAASTLAGILQEQGIGIHDIIAIQMPRTKEYLVAVLGILKIGAAFLPIDQEYPKNRKDYILKDSQAKMQITQEFVNKILAENRQPVGCSKTVVSPDTTAYIIYTSGSTGKPKGVMIPRRALDSFVHTCVHTYQLSSSDRIFCHSNFSFDASIEDLFPILTCGGELHIPNEVLRKDVSAIKNYIVENHITGGNYTTAFGELLLDACPKLPIRYITLGGERLDKLPTNQTCRFFNSYGPTEFTVDATFWEKPSHYNGHSIPIGRPTCNCKAYVLDSHLRLLPNICTGQLYLSGPQIAKGYLNREELTREKFVPNPYATNNDDQLMYATGDLVRWNADGQLEYVGRNDSQIKLRGFRIELGEIDVTLSHFTDVNQSVTRIIPLNGRDILCSWYTTSSGLTVNDIHELAMQSLPKFMVPDVFIHLKDFPLTPNGKIDYKQLPSPSYEESHQQIVTPCSNAERILKSIVSEITGIEHISMTDDLFEEIGLSSLQAIKLAFIAKSKGLDVNVTTLYEQRNIRAIFQHAEKRCSSYWADGEYNPDKPVAILVCGYVYVHPLYDNFVNYFQKYFSIYIFDAFHENFMWKKEISCDILMDEYMDAFRKEVLGKPLNLIMGTCYGADLAIPFAERIRQETGHAYRVLAMDPVYNRRKLNDNPPYEMNPNEAIIEQYRISDTLQKTIPLPTYDGPMIIVGPTYTTNRKYPEYDNVFMTEEEMKMVEQFIVKNDQDWETHFPHVPKYKVPGDHYRFLETPNLPKIDEILTTYWPDIYKCKE